MIRDLTAKKIAADWYGGQFSPLYAFMSTGAITDGILWEIESCVKDCKTRTDAKELGKLYAYVKKNGLREPVANWHLLHW